MPRTPRVSAAGTVHHITSHAVDDRPLYVDDADRRFFLTTLADVTRRVGWRCLAFCLMTNHYHLLLEESDVPLWRGMRLVNGRYASAFNGRYRRTGALFRSRYRDTPMEGEAHLFSTIRYIALNPVEAGLCAHPADWPWSSYPQTIGLARGWSFVSTAWTLSLFAPQRERAVARLRQLVEEVPGTAQVPGTGRTARA
jgi:putative transposase